MIERREEAIGETSTDGEPDSASALPLRLLDRLGDEEGGSMVFGAITLFTLVVFLALIYNTGLLSADQMNMQNAADAAAYSGAMVGAENLNSVAAINDGMAYVSYTMMRYSIDVITYGTLKEYEVHPDFVEAAGFELDDVEPFEGVEGEVNPPLDAERIAPDFEQRYEESLARARKMIPAGVAWLRVLAESERVIARATPRLMEETIFQVAKANGAERVSIVPELTPSFFYALPGEDGESILADAPLDGDELFPPAFATRYGSRRLFVEDEAIALPEAWYDASRGQSVGERGYFQIRVCWNPSDLAHGTRALGVEAPAHLLLTDVGFRRGPPNGHWHKKHRHLPNPKEHSGGHGLALADPADPPPSPHRDPNLPPLVPPPLPHHAVQDCPTCRGLGFGEPDEGVSDVMVSERSWNPDVGNVEDEPHTIPAALRELRAAFGPGDIPRPLVLRRELFTAGINVAVHRESRGTMIGAIFPVPGWGQMAVASARIGLVDGERVDISGGEGTWLGRLRERPEQGLRAEENLFLEEGTTVFSARLSPLTKNSYGRSLNDRGPIPSNEGLRRLLAGNRWRLAPDLPPDERGRQISQAIAEQLDFDSFFIRRFVLH